MPIPLQTELLDPLLQLDAFEVEEFVLDERDGVLRRTELVDEAFQVLQPHPEGVDFGDAWRRWRVEAEARESGVGLEDVTVAQGERPEVALADRFDEFRDVGCRMGTKEGRELGGRGEWEAISEVDRE